MNQPKDRTERMATALQHRKDGSWFLSGLVIRDAMNDTALAQRILVDLLGVALNAPESGVAIRVAEFVPFHETVHA